MVIKEWIGFQLGATYSTLKHRVIPGMQKFLCQLTFPGPTPPPPPTTTCPTSPQPPLSLGRGDVAPPDWPLLGRGDVAPPDWPASLLLLLSPLLP